MNPILKRLASLRRKVRLLDGWQGVCALVALVLGVGVVVGTLDYWLHLPSLIRGAALVGLLVSSGVLTYAYLFRPFSRPCDDLNLALRVEDVYPELNDSLASTVQFLKQTPEEQARLGGSEALRQKTMRETIEKASACDFGRILDYRSAGLFSAGAFCGLLVAGFVVWLTPAFSAIAFWRFVEPFGQHTWTSIAVARQAPLELLEQQDEDSRWEKLDPRQKKSDVIAIGRPYFIKVDLHGQIPKKARVEIEGQILSVKEFELKATGSDKHSASFITAIDMTQQKRKFKFRVMANDGAFPRRAGEWQVVEVLPPPKLVDLDGQPSPQITIHPPEYTDLPTKRLSPGTRRLDLVAGSHVILRAKADRPLAQAWIEYRPENALATPASVLTFLGQTNPLQAAAQAAGGQAVWGRVPAEFDADMSVFQISFTPWVTGSYALSLRDHHRLDNSESADLRVNLDPLPEVKLQQPSASVTAVPTAEVAFKFLALDPQFAVKKVYLEFRRRGDEGTLTEPEIIPLFDAADYGKLLPLFLARAMDSPIVASDVRLRHQKLEFNLVWALRNQFKHGDVITVQVCAEDFCNLYGPREPGRSSAVELRIISKQKLLNNVDEKIGEIIKRIEAIEKIQEKAQEAVKEAQGKDKFDQKARENFSDKAVTQQREVRDRVEGLRQDINDVKRALQENKLTDSPAFRDASKIGGTLDAIGNQELQQIEPKLTEANNDIAKNDKNSPKTKKTLADTDKLQKDVRTALNELIKDLNPGAKVQNFRKEFRDLNAKQDNLREDLENLKTKKEQLFNDIKDPDARKQQEKKFADDINAKRMEQLDLANQLDNLLKQMKAAKTEYEKNGDQANAQKLKDAIKNAEEPKTGPKQEQKPPITGQMKDVARQLQDKTEAPQKALEQQKEIQKNLEKILDSLEGKNENALNKEIQNRKEAQKKLDEIAKKLDKLQKDTKKADMEPNLEERLKKKQELAKQHEALQQEIAEMRRQLARLNEQRAANELNEANNQLDKAIEKIQQGDNPEENQKKAKEEINRAKRELKDAQEQLARELLIKIADQLEGLKIRQAAVLERSESLHAKIMKRKQWTDPYLDSIEGNMEAQKSIAEDTDAFKEKLKGAKVFHSILEKAKESMDKAGKAMEERRTLGLERRENRFNPEETKDEIDAQGHIIRHQKSAAARLDRLLDTLKEEIAKKPKKQDDQAKEPDGDPKEEQGGMQARDGIPPTAQLKALRGEQLDLNQRTAEFARLNPDLKKLNDAQTQELRDLSAEQERLHNLFQDLVAPPPDQPMPNEGEKKK
ncbi:MAG: hypothetical protein HYX68_25760 [Planctomycetes bacterium]|nr:hypothetical protein [Planctomycetota bacterium]